MTLSLHKFYMKIIYSNLHYITTTKKISVIFILLCKRKIKSGWPYNKREVKRSSTFTFTCDLSFIASILFANVNLTCVCTYKLRDSGNPPFGSKHVSCCSLNSCLPERKRSVKLWKRENNLRLFTGLTYMVQRLRKQAAFQTSKTTIYRPLTYELKSISKYNQLI